MVIVGWSAVHIPRHTVPIGEGQCRLVAVHMCSMRYPRLGVGMCVQQKMALRPSEMPSLTTASISLPEHRPGDVGQYTCILALGQRSAGTKAKREQSVVLRDRRVIDWVRWAVELSEPGGRL